MNTLADPPTAMYHLTEERDRISAVDLDGVEIAGAYKPSGHSHWLVYSTPRLTENLHQVIAPTQQIARWHVDMLARLWSGAQR